MSQTDRRKWDQRYREGAYAERTHPSALVAEWIERIPRGRALDVACGAGRNALFLAANGFRVDAVDISREALERGRRQGEEAGLEINWIEHDLDEALPLESDYALILMVRYVNLPLLRHLSRAVAPGGFLICEEHLSTDRDVAGPSSAEFRVERGALGESVKGLDIRWVHEGLIEDPDGRRVALARVVAQRPRGPSRSASE